MSNPILTSTNSKLDTRVKEPSGVVPSPPTGPGSLDRFTRLISLVKYKVTNKTRFCFLKSFFAQMKHKNIKKKLSNFNYTKVI